MPNPNNPSTLANTTAVILAGGLGTRLRDAVANRPKVLAKVGPRPFLSYLLNQLAAAGIMHVVLCTGYMGQMVREAFGSKHRTMTLAYSHEPAPIGTAGALRLALPLLRSDPVLVMNGDSYCEADLGAFATWFQGRCVRHALLLTHVADTAHYGHVEMDADGLISRFAEKTGSHAPGFINAGIYLLGRELLGTIPEGRAVSLEREIFPSIIGKGFAGFPDQCPFIDIGTPASYREAEMFFATLGAQTC
jgi:NDP-sugar pyrophosphorylase family protein